MSKKSGVDWTLAIRIGNHTYIPIGLMPEENADVTASKNCGPKHVRALKLLDAFERDHPELHITSWLPDGDHENIGGIYIDYIPKRAKNTM